jgi:tRNA threonylcarbamoyl adenosine modification protein YeaZ
MKTLALEFSSDQRSAALCDGGLTITAVTETGGRSTRAFAMIERALEQAGWERGAIECIAVGLGPGSYTGIRAAIAVAQGWQLARDIKLLGISCMDCLAFEAGKCGLTGALNIVVDAQRGEFYLATYQVRPDGFRETGALKIAGRDEVVAIAKAGGIIAGPGAAKVIEGARDIFPGAAALGEIAATRTDYLAGEKLEPVYLREISFVKAPPPRILPEH